MQASAELFSSSALRGRAAWWSPLLGGRFRLVHFARLVKTDPEFFRRARYACGKMKTSAEVFHRARFARLVKAIHWIFLPGPLRSPGGKRF